MDVAKGTRDLLSATATVTTDSFLSTYDFGDGDEPAIFTQRGVPEDASTGYIVISQSGGSSSGYESRGKRGGMMSASVMIVGPNSQSDKKLAAFATKVWQALHRGSLTLTGFEEHGMYADMPQRYQDEGIFPAYIINVSVRVLES